MHIVTFFSFAGGTIAFLLRLLGLFIMLLLVFLFWPEEGERKRERGRGREGKGGRVKDPYRQRGRIIRDWVGRSGGIGGAW